MRQSLLTAVLCVSAGALVTTTAWPYETEEECREGVRNELREARREQQDCIRNASAGRSFGGAMGASMGECFDETQRVTNISSSACSRLPSKFDRPSESEPAYSPSNSYGGSTGSGGVSASSDRSGAARPNKCPDTLEHLADKLPVYRDAELRELRSIGLETDIPLALSTARAQGFTTASAARAALEQAEIFERETLPNAEQCVRAAAANPEAVLAALRLGSYPFGNGAGNITTNCARAYIAAYYAAVVNRAAAVAMTCWARAGG